MILTLDIGNSNIKVAVFENEKLKHYWRTSTNCQYTCDEYGMTFINFFNNANIKISDIDGIMLSSVVPTINYTIEHMCSLYFNINPIWVVPGMKTGINIRYDVPQQLGSDRIANAVAAYHLYGKPTIFIDFGTATTFGAIDKSGAFIGGCICPGIRVASDALVSGTAKLSRFEFTKPSSVICRNTTSNLQSGVIYGYIGQVSSLIDRFKNEMNAPEAFVVATGGMAKLIAEDVKSINMIDGLLTLKGLRILYEKNS
ncbi:MAG: type III pantothenate kinase [Eubacteriales bacterium]|nr:type III pantothenate kinase [Eubacteriales bacterium]